MEAVVTVTYPFHPLVGQPVFVVGRIERGGVRHFIIRRLTGGSKSLLPEWMTLPEAGEIQIVSRPTIAVNRLRELRDFIDGLMPSSRQCVPGGASHETMEPNRTRTFQGTHRDSAVADSTIGGIGAAEGPTDRGSVGPEDKRRHGRSGGGR